MTTIDILIVAEDESDVACATMLADRLCLDTMEWADAESLAHYRRWRGEFEQPFLDIHKIHEIAARRNLRRVHGHFEGRPTAQDYQSAVQALRIARASDMCCHAVVWIRDTDGPTDRAQGWTDACNKAGEGLVCIGGFPHESMEAWKIVAWTHSPHFDPPAVSSVKATLKFDPTQHPNALSHNENVPKSAKAVVEGLAISHDVMESADLGKLESSAPAQLCGLSGFVKQVREQLAPLVRRGPQP